MNTKLSLSPTTAHDYWVFGHTQKQGGSTLQAGARYLLIPSDITRALSTTSGRLSARTMMFMGVQQSLLNYAAFRPYAMMEAIQRVLPENVAHPLVVDPAAGYSPQFIWLAQQLPHVRFVEIDLPEVIEDKRKRLSGFDLPENFEMIGVNLEETSLQDVLKGRYIDVIIALGAYVKHKDYIKLLQSLRNILSPEGQVVGAFPYLPGVEDLTRNSALFRRIAGEPLGSVKDENTVRFIFQQAGYKNVQLLRLSEMAAALDKPKPGDIEIIATAQV